MSIKQKLHQDGFTLLELMIATVIFSVILMATSTMLIQIGRMYYKGVIVNRTQETTRSITDNISQQLQFGADKVTTGVTAQYNVLPTGMLTVEGMCIGTQRYSYVKNAKVTNSAPEGQYDPSNTAHRLRHGLWLDTISPTEPCVPVNLSLAEPSVNKGGRELLGQNMRLMQSFSLNSTCNDDAVCTLSVGVIYGEDDLLIPNANNPTGCGNVAGSQWCAASSLSTQIFKRLRQGS